MHKVLWPLPQFCICIIAMCKDWLAPTLAMSAMISLWWLSSGTTSQFNHGSSIPMLMTESKTYHVHSSTFSLLNYGHTILYLTASRSCNVNHHNSSSTSNGRECTITAILKSIHVYLGAPFQEFLDTQLGLCWGPCCSWWFFMVPSAVISCPVLALTTECAFM